MAKTAVNLTWDEEMVKSLKLFAQMENRSLSNLTELIVTEYVNRRTKDMHVAQSFNKAQQIAMGTEILPYEQLEQSLMDNVHLDDDLQMINKLKES